MKDIKDSKIAVVGVGGVGGYIGGMLAKYYPHVSFVARGARGESIREKGFVLHSDYKGEILVHPETVAGSSRELEKQDIIFVCVKNYSLESACEELKGAVGPDTVVVPVMNGVDPAERTAKTLGAGIVVSACPFAGSVGTVSMRFTAFSSENILPHSPQVQYASLPPAVQVGSTAAVFVSAWLSGSP